MTWYPHVTVAAVIESESRFLLVYEMAEDGKVYNQPAGHLEQNETLLEAVVRETEEETGWVVEPTFLLGIREYTSPTNGITYLRHSFIAQPKYEKENAVLDEGIIKPVWMSYEEAQQHAPHLRSPLVLHDMQCYLSGVKYPLSLIYSHKG